MTQQIGSIGPSERDEDVSFLRGRIAQLVQTVNRISLPSSQEKKLETGGGSGSEGIRWISI